MTRFRVLIAALFVAAVTVFAAPASAQDYGPDGVFGGTVSGDHEVGEPITITFRAVGFNCDSWTVTEDDTGDAPASGPSGDTFTFTVEVDEEGTYSITAVCNTSDQNDAAPASTPNDGVVDVQNAGFVTGAGENFDTVTFFVGDDDGDGDGDDEGEEDGDGDSDDKAGGLPNTGGSSLGLLALGGGLAAVGTVIITRRRRSAF